jgi:hypothetical protein
VLAAASSAIVYRYLPHSLAPTGAMHGPLEAFEEAAEVGIGGVPPVFSDEVGTVNDVGDLVANAEQPA